MKRKAVFLDKDGTLVENVPYNCDPRKIRLTAGSAPGLRRLGEAGYLLIVVTNQPGVARGFFPEKALLAVERRVGELMSGAGAALAGFYYCPHSPDGKGRYRQICSCRKPEPGLLLRASIELDIDLTRSWFVGDILDDVEAGRRAGCKTILIANGNEDQWHLSRWRVPDYVAVGVDEASQIVIGNHLRMERIEAR